MMRQRSKVVAAPDPAPVDIPDTDRAALIAAYQAGLITAWKHDGDRRYRLTMSDRQDEYIETGKLAKYLERLNRAV